MKSFAKFIKEDQEQAAGFVRHYALTPNEIHSNLDRYPKPDELSFRSNKPAIKKSEKD